MKGFWRERTALENFHPTIKTVYPKLLHCKGAGVYYFLEGWGVKSTKGMLLIPDIELQVDLHVYIRYEHMRSTVLASLSWKEKGYG